MFTQYKYGTKGTTLHCEPTMNYSIIIQVLWCVVLHHHVAIKYPVQ